VLPSRRTGVAFPEIVFDRLANHLSTACQLQAIAEFLK
jgi:hypothetical protein